MEREVLDDAGGTLSLVELVREHGEALEFDLIRLGLRLRDCPSPEFNWRDLFVVCRYLGRDSALYAAMNPDDDPSWSVTDYLLAMVVDHGAARLWQAAGGKGRRPQPVPRPGDVKKYRGDALPVEDMADWLGWDQPVGAVVSGMDGAERAAAIRAALSRGEARATVAADFGVSVSTVGRIARGESWGDAPV